MKKKSKEKSKILVKISGDLLEKENVFDTLRELYKENSIVVLIGGGAQINQAFREKGYPIRKFGPLGRETSSLAEKQVMLSVLERNKKHFRALLKRKGIIASVIVPFFNIEDVLCPVNGDVFVKTAYLGFDKVYILTLQERLEKKKKQFKELPKIEIVGV